MKTTIMFKDGHAEVLEDCAPAVDVEQKTVNGILEDCTCYGDDVPFELIEKVVFEP